MRCITLRTINTCAQKLPPESSYWCAPEPLLTCPQARWTEFTKGNRQICRSTAYTVLGFLRDLFLCVFGHDDMSRPCSTRIRTGVESSVRPLKHIFQTEGRRRHGGVSSSLQLFSLVFNYNFLHKETSFIRARKEISNSIKNQFNPFRILRIAAVNFNMTYILYTLVTCTDYDMWSRVPTTRVWRKV